MDRSVLFLVTFFVKIISKWKYSHRNIYKTQIIFVNLSIGLNLKFQLTLNYMEPISRRSFLRTSLIAGAGLAAVPSMAAPLFIPADVLKGENAPSNRINIGVIGTGRIARVHDMPGVMKYEYAHIIAVCDLDAHRAEEAKQLVIETRTKRFGKADDNIKIYSDYEDLLADPEIDAVIICTPDHWHAKIAIEAVRAGKDVYCEKPTSLTIAEGRLMSNAVNSTGRIFQLGTQQRSMEQFRIACELVRSGRIGQLQEIEVRLPGDPAGGDPTPQPVPAGFNYEKWLGSTPYVPYTVDRVHPTQGYDRPGWLRCEQFGAGMITGWGNHHFDIAQWAMGTEYSGPVEIFGKAEFASNGLWDVHGDYSTEMIYENGVVVKGMTESKENANGLLFKGTEGWIFVCRGNYTATASDPGANNNSSSPLQASKNSILSPLGENDVHLYVSEDHHGNWLNSIRTRQQPISVAEVGHRSCSTCLLQHIAMRLGRRLYWDPILERFKNDDEANSMLSRPERFPYQIQRSL